MKNKFEEIADAKVRNYILEQLTGKELITHQGDVIHAEKAFVVNAVIRWVTQRKRKKLISKSQISKINKDLDQYIKGNAEMYWKDDYPRFRKVEQI